MKVAFSGLFEGLAPDTIDGISGGQIDFAIIVIAWIVDLVSNFAEDSGDGSGSPFRIDTG